MLLAAVSCLQTRYSLEVIQEEARQLGHKGIISRQQPIYSTVSKYSRTRLGLLYLPVKSQQIFTTRSHWRFVKTRTMASRLKSCRHTSKTSKNISH